jgi:hypothetical protein
MFYTPELLTTNANAQAHWAQLWASRDYHANVDNALRVNAITAGMQVNADGPGREFWKALDSQVLELRAQEDGMEILNDLLSVQTLLPIGKTAKIYNMVGNIDDSVAVSIDGQAPYSFDHTDYTADGDPIPIIQAGFGVNWRHSEGLRTVNIDLALDSQNAKQREYNKKLVKLMLDGAPNIVVGTYQSQGLRNHRNTKKINLGASGSNIDLTRATAAAMVAFFQGAFATNLTANRVSAIDVLWVSQEIMGNLSKIYVENGVTIGTVADYLLKFIRVKDIRPTFALVGNEFLGYVRSRDVVTPLVGMPTSTLPLPRPMPESNYNFRIMGAMGMQVKADANDMGGVFYGANLG